MTATSDIPLHYRSELISALKRVRRDADRRKKDLEPTVLDLGPLIFKVARHFGFCFGVENAIEIAYRALADNPGKRVFLLSEMIHNPHVNNDLRSRGVRFILDARGEAQVPFDELHPGDIVIIPAFGTTTDLLARLEAIGVDPQQYNATCPFVEKVWRRAAQLSKSGYTVLIHGKHAHEETKATFSHATRYGPALVVRDREEAGVLRDFISGKISAPELEHLFVNRYSPGFNAGRDLDRVGVVNQTTMLAAETEEIASIIRAAMRTRFGEDLLPEHFADTKDTLCYATTENQTAVEALVESGGDLALVIGGYNSSNTSHLVKLCESRVPTYYIKDAEELLSDTQIRHLEQGKKSTRVTQGWLPAGTQRKVVLVAAGASCPDILVDQVLRRVAGFLGVAERLGEAVKELCEGPPSSL